MMMPGFPIRAGCLVLAVLCGACNPGAFQVSPQISDGPPPAGRDAGEPNAGSGGEARAGQGGSTDAAAGGAGSSSTSGAGAAGGGKGGSASALAGAGGGMADACQRADPAAPVELVSMQEMGSVVQPDSVSLRLPGPITWIGSGKLVWLFAKNILSTTQPGVSALANHPSAAFVTRKDPTRLDESLSAGVPAPFVAPDSTSPQAELWPTALLREPPDAQDQASTGALVILQRVAADFSYDVLTTHLALDALTASGPLVPLFTGDDPKFSLGGYRGAEYGYLFSCTQDETVSDRGDPKHFPCTLARAAIADMDRRDRWRAYHASDEQWLADLKSGEPVLYGPSNALSVSRNNYLGRYIAVHSRWFSNEIIVQSAERIVGPWRVELTLSAPMPADGVAQVALEQPTLNASDCESSIWISYLAPRASSGGFPSEGEIKLLKVELK